MEHIFYCAVKEKRQMIFIFGGAYQGKLTYALENLGVKTVSDCTDGSCPDFTKDAVYGIEGFVLEAVRRGEDAGMFFRERRDQWADRVLICRDVSRGVVPADPLIRKYREENGRLMAYLAGEAEQVIRVFCGIGRRKSK